MNYVGHTLLAPAEPLVLLGNLLGDFVKGPLPGGLDAPLAKGVAMHRALDQYVDRHPRFRAMRQRFFPAVSHYAGVVADVVLDHLLLGSWTSYASEALDEFAERVYAVISDHETDLPEDLARHARRMVGFDAMRVYRTHDGLHGALARMSARLRRPVDLTQALVFLDAARGEFDDDLGGLWPDLVAFREGLGCV